MDYGHISSPISSVRYQEEEQVVQDLLLQLRLDESQSNRIVSQTTVTVEQLRNESSLDLLEEFLAEYGLSTDEGIALMCLAEAYLRTPDESSLDALIRDKIGSGHWEQHLGTARSLLINASSWGLMLTGKLLGTDENDHDYIPNTLQNLVRRLSEPAIRKAVEQVMKILGKQFVLGKSIDDAIRRAKTNEKLGYTHSYDMLGEAALTAADARQYFMAYSKAITALADSAHSNSALENHGISVKLSALHPRYETLHINRIKTELVPRVAALAQLARSANIGFTIDAEESERLELSLHVIREVLQNPELEEWNGFGIVVQAYSKQAPHVIDWLYELASQFNRQITIRLVKGAYWDYEIKNAQVQGLHNYPVFTRKQSTDLCYLVCAEKLLGMTDRIFPQFATHNAHTAHAILEIAGDKEHFEFQRLHGMGDSLHEILRHKTGRASRIYAPVGVHEDLLAYLVRRLLENGANSSFIHQLHDDEVPPKIIAADPVELIRRQSPVFNPLIPLPKALLGDSRTNSSGLSLNLPIDNEDLDTRMLSFKSCQWEAKPSLAELQNDLAEEIVSCPTDNSPVGKVYNCGANTVKKAVEISGHAFESWNQTSVTRRADILDSMANLYQEHQAEFIALGSREAGKTRLDGILELREAIDFCRYYAAEARSKLDGELTGRGPFVCISPWNFPLAIFTGQIVAALVAGNTVLAKPAEQTPLSAALAIRLMHQAGVPEEAVILLPGRGADTGSVLTSHPDVAGICFTGSTQTATLIDQAQAAHSSPSAPLIAETGGINVMFVDSTALPEQAVKHIISSAFQSAGQRCSALRLLLIQEEAAPTILTMLEGASMELCIGDPWQARVDVGPIIDESARKGILDHCQRLEDQGRLIFRTPLPDDIPNGSFVSPVAFRLESFEELEKEVFGPVLHVLTYKEHQLEEMVDNINSSGYGLTLGIQSRIDERIERICEKARVGNIYVNRNQIGAVVGVQPFGGEGKSGTGPKAGGPFYLYRFCKQPLKIKRLPADQRQLIEDRRTSWASSKVRVSALQKLADKLRPELSTVIHQVLDQYSQYDSTPVILTGPTGEMNTIGLHARGTVACLGSSVDHQPVALISQATLALLAGNRVVLQHSDLASEFQIALRECGLEETLFDIQQDESFDWLSDADVDAVVFDDSDNSAKTLRQLLAKRVGTRIPVLSSNDDIYRFSSERVISIDTTAAGGNATLLSS